MIEENDGDRVIVVGSGPAGAAAAHRLAARNIPVLVLEAGDRMPGGVLVRAFDRTVFKRAGRPAAVGPAVASGDPSTAWISELAPGGLSNHWTGAVPRYSPGDFADGERLGPEYRWPLNYDDLAPFYTDMERVLGVSGSGMDFPAVPAGAVARRVALPQEWESVARAAIQRGSGLLPAPLAAGPRWIARRGTTAFNSYSSLLAPMIKRGRVTFRKNSQVTRIHVDDNGRPRVECQDAVTGEALCFAGAAVVLAAGAINTPRILLQSRGSRSRDGLGNESGVLGAYLHDHPHAWSIVRLARPLPRLRHIAHLCREPYARSEPLLATQITVGGRLTNADRVLSAFGWPTKTVGAITFGTMIPVRSNRVQLTNTGRDAGPDQPIGIHMVYSDDALRNAKRATRRLVEILDDAGLAPDVVSQSQTLTPGSSVHFGGTARMHESADYGVVDRWSRLHECPRVLVADSSVFTTCVEKNPTLTAMALASRAADHLSASLQQRTAP